jgi:hypothetical protein
MGEPPAIILYERPAESGTEPARIRFDWGYDALSNFISVSASCGEVVLRTITVLRPDFRSLGFPAAGRWDYVNEEELEAALSEIAGLIQTRLFKWFEAPIQNPANLPHPLSDVAFREDVRQGIKTAERHARQLREIGLDDEAEKWEEMAREDQEWLSDYESSGR